MPAKHLTYFKVENFKKFESLELQNIGQFNLVTGDNNVGKTSLLEALTFKTDRRACMAAFHKTLMNRGIKVAPKFKFSSNGERIGVEFPNENILEFFINDLKNDLVITALHKATAPSEKNEIKIKLNAKVETENIFNFNNITFKFLGTNPPLKIRSGFIDENLAYIYNPKETFFDSNNDGRYLAFVHQLFESHIKIELNSIKNLNNEKSFQEKIETAGIYEHYFAQNPESVKLPLIYTSIPNQEDLVAEYFNVVGKDIRPKKDLLSTLKSVLIHDLDDIEVRRINEFDNIFFALTNKDKIEPISMFGESVLRFFFILLELRHFQGERLMIDEIDTGIHHSRMKGFLKAVIKAAELNEVQLFMTTHSLECQQKFVEVFEDADMAHLRDEVRNYTLLENKDGKVVANSFSYGQLEHALNTEFETRG
jgi:AAA15 family ATPase/GTPase